MNIQLPGTPPIHFSEFRVVERYIDLMGHMSHLRYFDLFEDAWWTFLYDRGLNNKTMKESKVGLVYVGKQIQYKHEINLYDTIKVETFKPELRGVTFVILQSMKNQHNTECARLMSTAVPFDLNERKVFIPTKDWLKSIGFE